ncbi:aminoglycoside 6'-N-acetyltransferase [Ornithinibacillus sp. 179-J 7C1 HS]|uniref:aminoglycoside 6'-N-acetyltransferase n=1 Tax=Ornithinibacillus sp. 179-J 7C1 HS TaxID=3142384 RepID=UPI0039A31827
MGKIIEVSHEKLKDLTNLALELYSGNIYEGLYRELEQMLNEKKHQFLLYMEEEQPVAFIHLSIRSDYVEGSDSSPTGYLEGIFVKQAYRRQGISTELFNCGKKWLKEQGCTQIGSDMEIDNQDSYPFHMSLGFKEAGRLITFIRDLS